MLSSRENVENSENKFSEHLKMIPDCVYMKTLWSVKNHAKCTACDFKKIVCMVVSQ